jgi:hypothetical protein
MWVNGKCHCGEITFEADVDPDKTRICHCTDCQRLSGSPFRVVVPVAETNFRLLSGEPKIYIKISDNGNERQQVFCPTCGTPIYASSNGPGPKTVGVRIGAIEGGEKLVPKRQFWAKSAVRWLDSIGQMARFERQ